MTPTRFVVPNISGRCRWCRCTDDHGCELGCAWVDRAHTLCSACVPLERAMRTATGRAGLADLLHHEWAMSVTGSSFTARQRARRS